MKKFDWYGYDKKHILTHPWVLLGEFASEIKYATQRVFRGYDDTISWSLDHHLAETISTQLKVIKNRKGIPLAITEPTDFDSTGNFKFGFEEKRRVEYQKILDDIIEGFEAYLLMDEIYGDEELYDTCKKKFDKGIALFVKYYSTFWW